MTLFGVVSRCIFSELPDVKRKIYSVNVSPALPTLHVSSDLPKSPYMVTGGDNVIVTSAILQIYVGEQRECHIRLKNNGPDSITAVDVMFESEKYQDILEKVLKLDLTTVMESLPLKANEETTLIIRTVGSLRLAELPDESFLSPHGSADRQQRPSSAVTNKVKLIESLLKITYTGVEANKELYYRECTMAIDTVLIPSINIISKSLKPVDADKCNVSYEVFNESNMALDIKSGHKSVLLKPMQSDWVHCTVSKCSSSASLEECGKSIDRSIDLTWQSEERHRKGLISTDGLDWDPSQLEELRKRPFTITGSATKNSCSRYPIGVPIHLSYTISNISESCYADVEVKVRLFQDIAATRTEVELGTAFVYIGPSAHTIDQFESGISLDLQLALAVFYSGQYFVECQCLHDGSPIPGVDPGLSIIVT